MLPKQNILIIEDNQSQAEYFKSLLSSEKYNINIINDGSKALEYINNCISDFSIIILDYHLPGLNGLEILKQINFKIHVLGAVFLTTNEQINTAIDAMKAGAYEFIVKTGNIDALLPIIIRKAEERLKIEKERQEALKIQENYRKIFTQFFQQSPIPSCLTRLKDEIIVDANLAFCLAAGLSKTNILNHTSNEFNFWVDKSLRNKILSIVSKRKTLRNIEFEFYHKADEIKTALGYFELFQIDNEDYLATQFIDISETKKANKALALSEEKFRNIFENMQDVYFETTLEGILLEVSPSIKTLSKGQYCREEVIGKSLFLYYANPENRNELIALLLKESKVQDFEVSLKNKDGKIILCSIFAKLCYNIDGIPHKIIGSVRDITERKNAEIKLKKRETRYQLIAEKLTDVIWLMDLSGKSFFVTPSIEKFTGYTISEYLNQSIEQRFTKESAEFGRQIFAQELSKYRNNPNPLSNYNYTLEMEYVCKDGKTKWGELIISPYFNENNELIGIHGVTRDITIRKQAIDDLKFQSLILNSISDLVTVTDLDGKILYVNEAETKIFDKSRESLIGLSIAEYGEDEYRGATQEEILRETIKNKSWRGEVVNYNPNGKPIILDCRTQVVNDKQGNPKALVGISTDISEIKNLINRIEESEKMFRSITENAFDFIAIIDLMGRYTYCNRTYERVLGYKPESLIGRVSFELGHIEDREMVKTAFFNGLAHEIDSGRVLARVVDNHGGFRWVDHFARPLYITKKRFDRVLIIGQDVTERKEAEDKLKMKNESLSKINEFALALTAPMEESNLYKFISKKLKDLFQGVAVSFGIYNSQGKYIHLKHLEIDSFIYQKSKDLLGFEISSVKSPVDENTYQEIIKNKYTIRDSLTEVSFGAVNAVKAKIIETTFGINKYFGLSYQHDGKLLGTSVVALKKSSIIPNAEMIDSFISLVSLALLRKNAEIRLLEEEKQQLELINNMGEGVGIVDENEYFLFSNPAANEIFEVLPDTLIGKNLKDFIVLEEIERMVNETKNRKKGIVGNYEITIKTKSGIIKNLLLTATPKFDEQKRFIATFGTFRDITESKKNIELVKELEVAKNTAIVKHQFLANMSHEIRTPLNGIIGMTEIIGMTMLNDQQRDYLQTIKNSSDALMAIVNDILDLSKIEAGKMTLNLSECSLKTITEIITGTFNGLVNNKPIAFKIFVDKSMPNFFLADEKRLIQIINNLLTNAIKFTIEGNIEVKFLLVRIEEEKFTMRIEIIDSGIGISKENQAKLFTNFTQIDSSFSRAHEGSGLGLAICRELVQMMDGEIGIMSEPNKGSTFWFSFSTKYFNKGIEIRDDKSNNLNTYKNYQLNVLLVEDNLVNRKIATLMLDNLGCKTKIAENGQQALDIFKENYFDIILLDIQMPIMDGLTTVSELRSKYKKLPIIVGLSANAMEGDAEKYINLGMNDYLTKPISIEKLQTIFEKWFNN